MVALWIRAGTAIAGQGPLGIRLLAPLSAALGSALFYRAAADLLNNHARALQAALLLNATLLFGAGAVTMTPDTPLLFFWVAALWALSRLIATGQGAWWLAAGAACGLAMASKYTAILFPAGIALWLACARDQGRWLRRPYPCCAALLAAALFAPTIWWNADHHWASFAKQGGRTFDFHPAAMLGHLGELIAGQAALATPLIFILCLAGLAAVTRTALRARAPAPTLLACLSLPAAALFAEHALGDRVQANWPAIVYPAAAIAALAINPGWVRRLRPVAIGLGALLTALVYLQSTAGPLRLSRRLDPTLRLSAGFAPLAAQLRQQAALRHASFIAADDYGTAALLAATNPNCTPVVGIDPRWALFNLPPAAATLDHQPGLLLRAAHRATPPSTQDWTGLTQIGTLVRSRAGQIAETYTLFAGTLHPGPAVVLPCPEG